jgi:hypothetical protein
MYFKEVHMNYLSNIQGLDEHIYISLDVGIALGLVFSKDPFLFCLLIRNAHLRIMFKSMWVLHGRHGRKSEDIIIVTCEYCSFGLLHNERYL